MNKKSLTKTGKDHKDVVNIMSVGVTWVEGKLIFKEDKKWANFYYGVCHFSKGVFAITPLDYEQPTIAITTIIVDNVDSYCDRAYSCMNLHCNHNRFQLEVFLAEFAGMGAYSLALPKDFGRNEDKKDQYNWFNEGKWKPYWGNILELFKVGIEGGVLRYSAEKAMQAQNSPIIMP